MPLITNKHFVEGQSIRHTINTGKDLTSATDIRIYYKYPNGSGGWTESYWDAEDGVTVFETTKLRYVQNNVVAGLNSVFPEATFPGNLVSRSADPVQFRVRKIHRRDDVVTN